MKPKRLNENQFTITCTFILFNQTSSAIYGKQQNDTSGDEVKTRRRREADDNQKTPNSKVKREAEPVQDKPQTELVR